MLSLWLFTGGIALAMINLVFQQWIWPRLRRSSSSPSASGIPVLTGTKHTDYRALIEGQYVKHPDQVYLLNSPFRCVYVLPPRMVNEYAWKPEHKVSSAVDLCERFLGEYTLIGSMTPNEPGDRTHTAVTYAKGMLTRSINHVLPGVYNEVDAVLNREVRKEGRTMPVQALVLKIFLHAYERVFVGPDLARNETWMNTCVEYPGAAFQAALALAKYHWLVRPIAALLIPEMKRLRGLIRIVDGYLRHIHQKRQEDMKQADFKKPADIVQSFLDNAGNEACNTDLLVESMVMVNIAGIQSTGRVLFQALLDLAEHPECIQPLRDELATVIAEEGGDEKNLMATGLARLHKMDSFFKESQRFHHANLLSVYRKLIQPLTLSNGIVLPANSYVAVPGSVYSRLSEEDSKDRPFDGFQWAEKKKNSPDGKDSKFNYAFSGPDSLEFGAGSHACPGRHFAANVLKATLSRILTSYDIQLPQETGRPQDRFNHLFDIIPNPSAALVFTPRKVS